MNEKLQKKIIRAVAALCKRTNIEFVIVDKAGEAGIHLQCRGETVYYDRQRIDHAGLSACLYAWEDEQA